MTRLAQHVARPLAARGGKAAPSLHEEVSRVEFAFVLLWRAFFVAVAWLTIPLQHHVRSTLGHTSRGLCGSECKGLPQSCTDILQVSRDQVARDTSHVARHVSHVTHPTSLITRHTSLVTRHTSHVTRHTSHVTRHTSHVTGHTCHDTRHMSHL